MQSLALLVIDLISFGQYCIHTQEAKKQTKKQPSTTETTFKKENNFNVETFRAVITTQRQYVYCNKMGCAMTSP